MLVYPAAAHTGVGLQAFDHAFDDGLLPFARWWGRRKHELKSHHVSWIETEIRPPAA